MSTKPEIHIDTKVDIHHDSLLYYVIMTLLISGYLSFTNHHNLIFHNEKLFVFIKPNNLIHILSKMYQIFDE